MKQPDKFQKPGHPQQNPQKPQPNWPEKKPQNNPYEKEKHKK